MSAQVVNLNEHRTARRVRSQQRQVRAAPANYEITPADLNSFMFHRAIAKTFLESPSKFIIQLGVLGLFLIVLVFTFTVLI